MKREAGERLGTGASWKVESTEESDDIFIIKVLPGFSE